MTCCWRNSIVHGNALLGALVTLVLTLTLMPAVAAGPPGAATRNATRLESMQIEIWPEYDRPAALVILRAEVGSDIGLPAAVSLRIPASSGGPAAVAYTTAKKGQLLNLTHERSDAAGFITLHFSVPTRFFQVEFYDRLVTGTSERTYKYLWPGDLPVSWLDLVLQEPAGASNISAKPELGDKSTGSDGLLYRAAQLGPFEQGKPLPIEIRYTKSDPRTSVELLKLSAPAANIPASTPPLTKSNSWLIPALVSAVLLIAASAAAYFFWWRRRQRSLAAAGSAGFCSKCRNRISAGDRFCAGCGTPLA